jgi:hypothetical protein
MIPNTFTQRGVPGIGSWWACIHYSLLIHHERRLNIRKIGECAKRCNSDTNNNEIMSGSRVATRKVRSEVQYPSTRLDERMPQPTRKMQEQT